MKLSDTIGETEILWEGKVGGEGITLYLEPVEEGVFKAGFGANKNGGLVKTAGDAFSKMSGNAFLVGMVAGAATSALKRYTKNKRMYTTRFYAKSVQERQLYKKIVDDLMKTGHYKKIRKVHVEGGILWELQRKGVR